MSRVADVMAADVVTIGPDTGFRQMVAVLAGGGMAVVPVVDADGLLLGVVSQADLVSQARRRSGRSGSLVGGRWRDQRVVATVGEAAARDVMTVPAVAVAVDARVEEAVALMDSTGHGQLPVVDGVGRLVGVVARCDLLRRYLRSDEEVRGEIVAEVLGRALCLEPGRVAVRVRAGVVSLEGRVERRRGDGGAVGGCRAGRRRGASESRVRLR